MEVFIIKPMNKNNIQKITQGAMMLSIIAVFLIINLQTAGLLELYAVWLLPLPIIFYEVKFGFKASLVMSIAALILSFLLGSLMTLFYVTSAIVIGLVYGYGVSKDKDNGWLIFFTTLFSAISTFLEMYVFASFFGYDLVAETHEIVNALKNIEGLIVPANLESLVLAIYPLALFFMAFLQAIIVHLFSLYMLKRLKIKIRKMKDITQYRLPRWAGLMGLIGLFSGAFVQEPTIAQSQWLMLVISFSSLMFMIDAYILLIIIARKYRLRYLVTFALLSIVILPSLGIYAFIGLGLLDSFTDFRLRIINHQKVQ